MLLMISQNLIINHVSVDIFLLLGHYKIACVWLAVQIRSNVSTSMQYQLRHLYNTTGTRSMNTSSLTYRVTVAWDELQRQVRSQSVVNPFSPWHLHVA